MKDRIPRRLQHRHETCCEKGSHRGRQACMVQRWHHHRNVVFQTDGLVYDRSRSKRQMFVLDITRELNGVSSTKLPTLYTLLDGLYYYYV